MDGASLENALRRIEDAIVRIEQTAVRPVMTDAGLRDRHEQLRSAVAQSLSQLDELLAGGQS